MNESNNAYKNRRQVYKWHSNGKNMVGKDDRET